MATVDLKFISGVLDLFAPKIQEGQIISAYVGEDIQPYIIQGENFSTFQAQFDALSKTQ